MLSRSVKPTARRIALLGAAIAALALAGCGLGSDEGDEADSGGGAEAAAA